MSNDVFIVGAARTPVGSFMGALAQIPAPTLGGIAIGAAITRANAKPDDINECIMGEVLTAGVGQLFFCAFVRHVSHGLAYSVRVTW